MAGLFGIALPLLRQLPPETAHWATLWALKAGVAPRRAEDDPPCLAITLWGRNFPNPVGLAAGFDKNAEGATRNEAASQVQREFRSNCC